MGYRFHMDTIRWTHQELSASTIPHLIPSNHVDERQGMVQIMSPSCVVMSLNQRHRLHTITKKSLVGKWHIGLEAAQWTLQSITQTGMRYVEGNLELCLRTCQSNMRFPKSNTRKYTDTLFATKKSICGCTCAQLFTDGACFCRVYPIKAIPCIDVLHPWGRNNKKTVIRLLSWADTGGMGADNKRMPHTALCYRAEITLVKLCWGWNTWGEETGTMCFDGLSIINRFLVLHHWVGSYNMQSHSERSNYPEDSHTRRKNNWPHSRYLRKCTPSLVWVDLV